MRHPAAVVLGFAVAAVMAGADSVTAIAERASDVPPEALGARRDRRGRLVPPSRPRFRRVLRRLDGQGLAAAFGTWLKGQVTAGLADAGALVVALDGKTVRGARAEDGKAPHLLAAMICGARAVLAQRDVDHKTNEITQVKPLLGDIDIAGALVTADALHVDRPLPGGRQARRLPVHRRQGQPARPVCRARCPGLAERASRAYRPGPRARPGRDPHHPGAPRPQELFPYAAQAFLIERTVRDPHDGQLRSSVAALGITTRTVMRGGTAEVIAAAARGHGTSRLRSTRHDHARRCPAAPLRDITPGHGRRPQHRHRRLAPGRVHCHRHRTALGRTEPRKAHRSPESHITRMTTALGPVRRTTAGNWNADLRTKVLSCGLPSTLPRPPTAASHGNCVSVSTDSGCRKMRTGNGGFR